MLNSHETTLSSRMMAKLPESHSEAHFYIRRALKRDSLLYIPCPLLRERFLSEWTQYCPSTVIVSEKEHEFLSNDENKVTMMKYDNITKVSAEYSVIFEEADDSTLSTYINNIKEGNINLLMKDAAVRVFITSSPLIFNRYIQKKEIECVVSKTFTKKPFYRSLFETAEVVYYQDDSNMENEMARRNIFHPILNPGSNLLEASEKIQCLIKILELLDGRPVFIYFENELDQIVVKEILTRLSKPENDSPDDSTSFRISNRSLNSVPLNVTLIRQISSKLSTVILFDFIPLSTADFRIFLCSNQMKERLKTLISEDLNIPKMIISNSDLVDSTNKPFKYEILDGDINLIRNNCKSKSFIVSVDRMDGKIQVTARSLLGKVATSVNIYNTIKEPTVIPKMRWSGGHLILFSNSLELCTLTSLKTMVNSKIIPHNGYLLLLDGRVNFYSFSKEKNLLFEFAIDDIEDFILVSLKRSSEKEKIIQTRYSKEDKIDPFTVKEYLDITRKEEINKDGFMVSFCLRNKPRVYCADQSSEIAMKIKETGEISEKCQFFSTLEWKRQSLNEYKDLEERFDIRVSIPCFQDIPEDSLDLFMYYVKENELKNSESKDEADTRRKQDHLRDIFRTCLLTSIVKFVSYYPVKIVITEVSRISNSESLLPILENFYNFEFGHFYAVLCLFSRKGRFLLSNIKQSDVEYMSHQNLPVYCEHLDRSINRRFSPINFRISVPINKGGDIIKIRTALISPLNTIFEYEKATESNRVLRQFDPDKFCKVLIREENGRNKFSGDHSKNTDDVYEYFRNLMINGLIIGLRKYFFLVMTTSQLKIHGSWFITPYEDDGVMIGTDYIKSWIGNFHKIKNIGKYAARIGLALSTTTPSCVFDDFVEVEDIEKNSYCFTDGVGLICSRQAQSISTILGLKHVPSAFQIRFGGYKGVVVMHPWMDDKVQMNKWLEENEVSAQHGRCLEGDSMKLPELILRKSMNKFDSSYRNLEIITYSKPSEFYLNRQIIMILEGLGVPRQTFIDLQDSYIVKLLSKINDDFSSFIRKNSQISFNIHSDISFYRKLQAPILSNVFQDLNQKSRILIEQGRGGIGVLDELGILEEDEIFCMFRKRDNENMENLKDYGSYVVPVCHCIVAKNPVMHPGDIRLVRCVDNPKLHYLKDVVVFSKKGDRPIFNQCSGSDLDGDTFLVSWCKALVPKVIFKPYNYVDSNALVKDKVLLSDIINFYIRHMKFYQLGSIANSYMAIADKYSIFDEKALKISEIFNKSIDYVKTGNITSIPEDLIPTEYPDFMERAPSYYSQKALGHLYRRSLFDLSRINFCECYSCTMDEIQEQPRWKEFILLGSGVKTREIRNKRKNDRILEQIYEDYCGEIRGLMDQLRVKNEEELFCYGFDQETMGVKQGLKAIINRYTEILKNKESLEMMKICECRQINSIVTLCGDAYKIKENMKRMMIKKGSSNFYFNSKIHLVDDSDENFTRGTKILDDETLNAFYENRFSFEEICIRCDSKKYEMLISKLDIKRKDMFRDLFNLLILSEYFKLNQIDEIFDLLIFIHQSTSQFSSQSINQSTNQSSSQFSSNQSSSNNQSNNNNSNNQSNNSNGNNQSNSNSNNGESSIYSELLRAAVPNSDNNLFKILCLLSLEMSLIKKCILLREKGLSKLNENFRTTKGYKRIGLIISGMLDENDDVEFSVNKDYVIPVLKNRGECSVNYYRDEVRDFLVNVLYSTENLKYINRLDEVEDSSILKLKNPKKTKIGACRAHYEVCFSPGRFFLQEVPEKDLSDRFSIKMVEKMILSQSIRCGFINSHDALNESRRDIFLSSIKKMKSVGTKEVLSFMFGETRYDVEFQDGVLNRITKDKKIIGKIYLMNGSIGDSSVDLSENKTNNDEFSKSRNDLQVELFRREIIYNDEISDLTEKESFMKEEILRFENGKYELLVDLPKIGCSKLKLEKRVIFENEDGFTVTRKYLYTGERTLNFKAEMPAVYTTKEFSINTLEGFDFDKIFRRLWKIYKTMF